MALADSTARASTCIKETDGGSCFHTPTSLHKNVSFKKKRKKQQQRSIHFYDHVPVNGRSDDTKECVEDEKKIKLSWHQDRDSYSLEPSQQTIRQYMTCRRTDDCPDERNVEEVFLRLFHHIQMTSSEAIPSLISIEFYSSGVLCTYESCGKNFTAAVVVVIDSY